MSDINAIRLPGLGFVPWWPAYVGDDVNPTLTRGDKWAQHSSNDLPIVLMRCVLVFVEYLVHWYAPMSEGVAISPLNAGNSTDLN